MLYLCAIICKASEGWNSSRTFVKMNFLCWFGKSLLRLSLLPLIIIFSSAGAIFARQASLIVWRLSSVWLLYGDFWWTTSAARCWRLRRRLLRELGVRFGGPNIMIAVSWLDILQSEQEQLMLWKDNGVLTLHNASGTRTSMRYIECLSLSPWTCTGNIGYNYDGVPSSLVWNRKI